MAVDEHRRIGTILLKEGLVNEAQLREAVHVQKTTGKRLGEVLVERGVISEDQMAQVLGRQLGIPYRHFTETDLPPTDDPELKKLLPERVIRRYLVLPLSKNKGELTVALADPLDVILLDNLRKMTGCRIRPVLSTPTDLRTAIQAVYGKMDLLKKVVEGSYETEQQSPSPASLSIEQVEDLSQSEGTSVEDLAAKAGEAQVVRLVDLFLLEAVNSRASDIHVEPQSNRISIRFRIDGVLQHVDPPAPQLLPAIVSRIKILARMDIAEKRLPQDGGFTIRLGERTIDLRVSTIPVVYGEKVVVRLLDKSHLFTDFVQLGLEGTALQEVEQAIRTPYGLIFATGPTGSGKSTSLYAILSQLNGPTKNILTIEDPIEYKVPGVNQVQAKPSIGLTFASGLRAFLRQDPDIIMVGEVRDLDTAEICVRAALTGHLVLSTLHTNDASSAITRLIDLGIEPFLLSPSLVMIIAQRLVRRLCPECRESFQPDHALKERARLPEGSYYRATGCAACRKTGYRGRIAIFEVLLATPAIREQISQEAHAAELRKAVRAQGMKTLFESGVEKAAQGITSLEEVFSIVAEI